MAHISRRGSIVPPVTNDRQTLIASGDDPRGYVWGEVLEEDTIQKPEIVSVTHTNSGTIVGVIGTGIVPIFITDFDPSSATGVNISASSSGVQSFAVTTDPQAFTWDYGADSSGFVESTFGATQQFLFTPGTSGSTTGPQFTYNIRWGQFYYAGVAGSGSTLNESFIQGLSSSGLISNDSTGVLLSLDNTNNTGYIYFAFRQGSEFDFYDVDTGMWGGINRVASGISVTNMAGISENYAVYMADYPGLGNKTFIATGV